MQLLIEFAFGFMDVFVVITVVCVLFVLVAKLFDVCKWCFAAIACIVLCYGKEERGDAIMGLFTGKEEPILLI